MSTYFKRKEIYKSTWLSPRGSHIKQIDHVIVNKKHHKIVTNVRSNRGVDITSGHFLVRANLRMTRYQKKRRWRKQVQLHLEELRKEEIQEQYKKDNTKISRAET